MKITKIFISLALSLFFTHAFAEDAPVKIVGTESVTVATSQPAYIFKSGAITQNKHILLQRVALSTDATDHIIEQLESIEEESIPLAELGLNLPVSVNLGMNNVPVLDQGVHGTCVTFATTAAIDAVYGKEDYISQLCNLSLGSYLAKISAGSYPSGWNGSLNKIVLSQIKTYGIISMNYQLSEGCADLKEYPARDSDNNGDALSPDEFAKYSENIMASMSTVDLLKIENAFTNKVNMQNVFNKVKQALTNQHRVIIGFLVDNNDGDVGAYGTYKVKNDSWVLTPKIFRRFRSNVIHAGHAIIIIGYDDNAIIHRGKKSSSKGAFILRNSWGKVSGNEGNYYMSYDYFRTLTDEAAELAPMPSQAID